MVKIMIIFQQGVNWKEGVIVYIGKSVPGSR